MAAPTKSEEKDIDCMIPVITPRHLNANVVSYQHTKRSERLAAILELKTNSTAAFTTLQGTNEAVHQRQTQREYAQRSTFEALRASGKNPYAVSRAHQINQKVTPSHDH